MADITTSTVATAIVKLIAADALPALMANLVMGNLVNRSYEPVLANAGDTINVPIPPVLVANNLAEGNSVQLQTTAPGNAQIVLTNHVEASFQITDVAKALATPDLMKLYLTPAVIAIASRVESDCLGMWSQFTTNTVVGTGGTAITEAVLDLAETNLFNALVPAGEEMYLVTSALTYSELRQIAAFRSWTNTADAGVKAIVNGEVGKLKNFNIFRSQLVPTTGTSPVTQHNLAFTRDAIGLVTRRLPQPLPGTGAISEYAEMGNFGMRVTMSYQPNTLAQQVTVDVLYGVGVLRNQFGQQVSS